MLVHKNDSVSCILRIITIIGISFDMALLISKQSCLRHGHIPLGGNKVLVTIKLIKVHH